MTTHRNGPDLKETDALPAEPSRVAPRTISRTDLLEEGTDSRFRELVNTLLAVAARHETIRAGHGAYIGLPAPQYTILITAAHMANVGPVRIKDLADLVSLSPTYITMELKKLYGRGLMRKSRNKEDSRVVDLFVTDKGYELLEELAPMQRQVNDQQFADMTKQDFDELLRLTKLLASNSDKAIALQSYLAQGHQATTG